MNTQQLPPTLESTLHKLKQVSERYSSKSALGTSVRRHEPSKLSHRPVSRPPPLPPSQSDTLNSAACFPAADYPHVSQQVKQLEEDGAAALAEVATAKSIMGRVLSAWESYGDCLSSLQAWLEQSSVRLSQGHRAEVLGARRRPSQPPPTLTDPPSCRRQRSVGLSGSRGGPGWPRQGPSWWSSLTLRPAGSWRRSCGDSTCAGRSSRGQICLYVNANVEKQSATRVKVSLIPDRTFNLIVIPSFLPSSQPSLVFLKYMKVVSLLSDSPQQSSLFA